MQLTTQQQQAIYTHDKNLVVVAGAGSGKTRVLVERYVALLEANPDWQPGALVAVTFTRKAAGEMRDRVRQRLEDRLRAADSASVPRWAELVASMDSARITTIHGLCADILRANAALAGIDPTFEILDETQAAVLLETTLTDALDRLTMEGHPAVTLFRQYDRRVVQAALTRLIAADVRPLDADLFAVWTEEWHADAQAQLEALPAVPAFADALAWLADVQPPMGDKLGAVVETARGLWAQVERGTVPERLVALGDFADAIKLNVGSAAAWGGKDLLQTAKDLLKCLREGAKAVSEGVGSAPGVLDRLAADLLPYWAALLTYAREQYRRARTALNALDFDDLEALTRDLLQTSLAVRARYHREFRHLLVDEFQDTNGRQWDIIKALADPARAGALFVVGDPKQSIYAFRGADVSVFGMVQRILTDPHTPAPGVAVPLAESFRTHTPLVDAFNQIFSGLMTQDKSSPTARYEVVYGEAMRASRQPPGAFPALNLLLLGAQSDKLNAEEGRLWEAQEIGTWITRAVEQERLPVWDRSSGQVRPAGYGDVALLFRSMTSVNSYEEAFKQASIPFVTVAGRGYYSRQEVWDLLNLLTALHNPADHLALAAALRSPLFALSDEALLALRLVRVEGGSDPLPLWQALGLADVPDLPAEEQARVTFAHRTFSELRALAGRVTISELLREALDRTGYLAVLTGLPDGDRRRGNVEKLLEKAHSSGYVTLGTFAQYLRDMTEREVREGEALLDVRDAVTLMTVHASKGLEFPVVVLVDTSAAVGRTERDVLLNDPAYGLACRVYDEEKAQLSDTYVYRRAQRFATLRETAERKRLLYVAATRAQDYLLVSGSLKTRSFGESWLGWLLAALKLDPDTLPGAAAFDLPYAWGTLRVMQPAAPPDPAPDTGGKFTMIDEQTAWERPPGTADVLPPALLRPVRVDRTLYARHLTATQIASLGSDDPYHQQQFRRTVLRDRGAAGVIPTVSEKVSRPTGKQMGEIVHEALRWWLIPDPDDEDLVQALERYAWEQGVTHPRARAQAVATARDWLTNIIHSDVFEWIADARQTFRELPFIYRTEKRLIHGVIDMLLQRDDGSWVVVDYKSSFVDGANHNKKTLPLLEQHAARYHLQLGVYAAAVREQLGGVTPQTCIHYIRYQRTVHVPTAQWVSALERLEDRIGNLMWEDFDS